MILKVKFKHIKDLIKVTFLLIIIGSIIINPLIYSLISPYYSGKNTKNLDNLEEKEPFSQSLTAENKYEGIGKPWNITHWANRTDKNLLISFSEGNSDTAEIPLGSNWEGYKLIETIEDLTDKRNWNNGTFNYGADDNNYANGSDDSQWIQNKYQNWTFQVHDTGIASNLMSGNYYANKGGHDCLELRMVGNDSVVSIGSLIFTTYDPNDYCYWNSTIQVPRGKVLDSKLNFQLYPDHLAAFNSWAFSIYINRIKVYSIGTYTLSQYGVGNWHSFSVPQSVWINETNVFPNSPINNNPIEIWLVLECNGGGNFSGFANDDFQQLYVDNVELELKTEALPSNLGLQVNGTPVQDLGWGKGRVSINGKWQASKVISNFTTIDVSTLGQYSVDLKTDLNLYAKKDTPDSNYELDPGSLGSRFSVGSTDSNVNWFSYGFIAVPTGYVETEMVLSVPTDFVFTGIYTPTEPSVNVISSCDTTTAGVIKIPVSTITDHDHRFS